MKPFTKNLLIILLLIAVVYLFTFLRGGTSTGVQFEGESMTLIAPQAFSYPIAYADIADIELVTWGNADDSLRNGSEENRLYIWGQWDHTEFGQCVLCLTKKIDNAILVTTTKGEKILFNAESADTTAQIYEAMPDLLSDYSK